MSESPENQLLAVRSAYVGLFNAGDWDGVCAMLAEDVFMIPPDREAFVGRDAARAMYEEMAAIPDIRVENDPVALIRVDGDVGHTVGSYTFHFSTPEGPVSNYGRSLELWRREADGTWLQTVDMWHNLPDDAERKRESV